MDKQFGLEQLREHVYNLIQRQFTDVLKVDTKGKFKEGYETYMHNVREMVNELQSIEFVVEIIATALLEALEEAHPKTNTKNTNHPGYNAVIEGEATESEDGLCFTAIAQPIYIKGFHLPVAKIAEKIGQIPKMRNITFHCTVVPNAIILDEEHEESQKEGMS